MRIVIDMQGAQNVSKDRGIGIVTWSLSMAIARNKGAHDVILALNGQFPETIESIRTAFKGLLPQGNIRVWESPGSLSILNNDNRWRRKTAELIRESFLASLNPSIVLTFDLFEGINDDSVTSIGKLSTSITNAVFLYDLIPLINKDHYLKNERIASCYYEKLQYLRQADLLLTTSDSVKQEAIDYINFEPEDIAVVSAGYDSDFHTLSITEEKKRTFLQQYGIYKPFVMYTGGINYRKNIEGLIRAFSKLSRELKQSHQLVIVCKINNDNKTLLQALGKEHGLTDDVLRFTGFVPKEDLVCLYNLCKLFVFPSFHEGFGLPVLEAMACGCPVICSDVSSLPEVINCENALFNPFDDLSITRKLEQALLDRQFLKMLKEYGAKRVHDFSWDKSAKLAIHAIERTVKRTSKNDKFISSLGYKPKMAYLSPLLPSQSGISDYSAELLPELGRYYEVELIVAENTVDALGIKDNFPIRTIEWFRHHASEFERVVYHFGNSIFHKHMFGLLEEIPGIIVLHDFFLSGILAHLEMHEQQNNFWTRELYHAHGYLAVFERFNEKKISDVIWKYPCNLSVLQNSLGLIVHSSHAFHLKEVYYQPQKYDNWVHIPHLRAPVKNINPKKTREILGISDDDFVICCFGAIGPTKLNHILLEAWLESSLSKDKKTFLIFVGKNDDGDYGKYLVKMLEQNNITERVKITGWVSKETYSLYLSSADLCIQLRTLSRGETSGAALDCMNYGKALIVNGHGSFLDLEKESVLRLPDKFSKQELVEAIFQLKNNEKFRKKLALRAQTIIHTHHNPKTCSQQYYKSIEHFYYKNLTSIPKLVESIKNIDDISKEEYIFPNLAQAIDRSIFPSIVQHQLFIDVSELVEHDHGTGIQRIVKNILKEWLHHPPQGYRIEPIYATKTSYGYVYARQFTLAFLGCPSECLEDTPISYRAGDVFFGLDLQPEIVVNKYEFIKKMKLYGVKIFFVLYDLLPVQFRNYFPDELYDRFKEWLHVVANSNGVIGISKTVINEFNSWIITRKKSLNEFFATDSFYLGSDIMKQPRSSDLSDEIIKKIKTKHSFLMVGTIEPRKGHNQTLNAFEILWSKYNLDVNLVIVGKQGWMVENFIEKLRFHPELNKRLFWLENIDDLYLENVYQVSTCLIAASEGEGFGLPLIEAAQYKIPILARNIPVFKEVAKEYAYYFDAKNPEGLARSIKEWISLDKNNKDNKLEQIRLQTWKESAEELKHTLLKMINNDLYSLKHSNLSVEAIKSAEIICIMEE